MCSLIDISIKYLLLAHSSDLCVSKGTLPFMHNEWGRTGRNGGHGRRTATYFIPWFYDLYNEYVSFKHDWNNYPVIICNEKHDVKKPHCPPPYNAVLS